MGYAAITTETGNPDGRRVSDVSNAEPRVPPSRMSSLKSLMVLSLPPFAR
jgi:hypothetical protein